MNGPLQRGGAGNRPLTYAIAASLVLHAVLLFLVSLERQGPRDSVAPGPIVARLVAPAVAPAPIAPQPEPPKPRAEEPRPPPKQVAQPAPVRKPSPIPVPAQRKTQPPEVPPPAQPAAPAAAQPSPSTPAAGVPATRADPQPSTPVAPSSDAPDIKTLIGGYGIQLRSQMRRYTFYPRVARDNHWEGKGELLVVIGANGMISEIRVVHSTGHEILDKSIVETVRKAKPLVPIPPALRGRQFSIEIPYEWRLTDAQ